MLDESNTISSGNGKQRSLDKVLDNLQSGAGDVNLTGSSGSDQLQMKNYGSIQSMVA